MMISRHNLDKRVFIVAEAGVNHEGSFAQAKRLVEKAKKAGADAIKFQTYKPECYVTRSDEKRFERVKRFALTAGEFRALQKHARRVGIIFFSTPLDRESVDLLASIAPVIKISSGDLNYEPLIRYIASKKKPMILSTGIV